MRDHLLTTLIYSPARYIVGFQQICDEFSPPKKKHSSNCGATSGSNVPWPTAEHHRVELGVDGGGRAVCFEDDAVLTADHHYQRLVCTPDLVGERDLCDHDAHAAH